LSDAIAVTIESPLREESLSLIQKLSAELGQRYGDDGAGAFTPADAMVPGAAFVIAWLGERPVGCGALRPMESGVAEVKRMYVEPDVRRCGAARAVLAKLEAMAHDFGYRAVRLETGTLQPEAIRLYEKAGYRRIARYGQYGHNPLSLCYEKDLIGEPGA
jgi:hypothetical protein